MYGKLLENGGFRYAPNTVVYKNHFVPNPSEKILLELGFLPVKHTDIPLNIVSGKHYEDYFEQGEGGIIQRWKLVNNPVYPPTVADLSSELLTMQINSFSLTDKQSLHFAPLYPGFEDLIGETVKQGFKLTYKDKLYKVVQPELVIQEQYKPGDGTESLYARIDEEHAGTIDDPIPAAVNMKYYKDKYYVENDVIYLCIRDSEQPLQYLPSQLVGQYFKKI